MRRNPLLRLQERQLGDSLILEGAQRAKDVTKPLRRRLVRAFRDEVLKEDYQHLVHKTTAFVDLPNGGKQEVTVVYGGREINRDRDPRLPHFRRVDGAWFDFHIHLRRYDGERDEHRGSLELFGYGYEIRFPPEFGCDVRWLRFDLNHPGHDNEARGVRSHFHPGDENLQAPSTVLHPEEALELLLSDQLLSIPEKRRTS